MFRTMGTTSREWAECTSSELDKSVNIQDWFVIAEIRDVARHRFMLNKVFISKNRLLINGAHDSVNGTAN